MTQGAGHGAGNREGGQGSLWGRGKAPAKNVQSVDESSEMKRIGLRLETTD